MYTAEDFGRALQQLLPPGAAFDWLKTPNGLGTQLLCGWGVELARAANGGEYLADVAIAAHTPLARGRSLADYQALVDAVGDPSQPQVQAQWAAPFRVGSRAGDRLWPELITLVLRLVVAPNTNTSPLVSQINLIRPLHVGLWIHWLRQQGGGNAQD